MLLALVCYLLDSLFYSCTAVVSRHTQLSNDDNWQCQKRVPMVRSIITSESVVSNRGLICTYGWISRHLKQSLNWSVGYDHITKTRGQFDTLGQLFNTIYFSLRGLLATDKLCLLVVFMWVWWFILALMEPSNGTIFPYKCGQRAKATENGWQ